MAKGTVQELGKCSVCGTLYTSKSRRCDRCAANAVAKK